MLLTTAYFPPVEYFSILARYSVVYLEAHERYCKQSWRNRCRILTANGPMDLNFPIVHDGSSMIRDIRVDWSTPWLHKTEYAIDSAYYSSPFFEYYRDELFGILDARPETLWEMNLRIIDFFCRKIGICPQIRETAQFCPAAVAESPAGVPPGKPCPPSDALEGGPQAERSGGMSAKREVDQGALLPSAQASSAVRLPGDVTGAEPPSKSVNGAAVTGAEPPSKDWRIEDLRYAIHPKIKSDYHGRPYWQVFREKFGFVDGLSIMDLLFNEGPESLCYLK